MTFTPSWSKISKVQIMPDSLIEATQHGGKPKIDLNGFVGRGMRDSFPGLKGLANRYQWDIPNSRAIRSFFQPLS